MIGVGSGQLVFFGQSLCGFELAGEFALLKVAAADRFTHFLFAGIASLPMGTRVMFSTPQAITTSAAPELMMLCANVVDCWDEPHWESMVMHGVSMAPPLASHAVRVMFMPWDASLLTQPPTTWSTCSDVRLLRAKSCIMT